MILSLPELTSYTGGWERVRFRPSEPCYICHSNGREPYQSTYFLVMAIALLSYLSIICTNSVIVMSYSDYNLKQNYMNCNNIFSSKFLNLEPSSCLISVPLQANLLSFKSKTQKFLPINTLNWPSSTFVALILSQIYCCQ